MMPSGSIAMISAFPQFPSRAAPPQFNNMPSFLLPPDPKYAPPVLCTQPIRHVQLIPRAPLLTLSNQHFTIATQVEEKWPRTNYGASSTLSHPRVQNFDNGESPYPPILRGSPKIELVLPPRASRIPASVVEAFLDDLKKGCIEVQNPRKRKLHTPFPPRRDDQSEIISVLDDPTSAPRKRTRKEAHSDVTSRATRAPKRTDAEVRYEKFHPIVEWLTVELYNIIIVPMEINQCSINEGTKKKVMHRILNILMTYMPENAIIVSAFWYISRLFSEGIIAIELFIGFDAVELIVRIFSLGLLLAWKWMHDAVIKTSSWTTFVSLTCESINTLEKTALRILDYNISISPGQWESWLISLQESTSSSGYIRAVIKDLLSSAQRVHGVYVSGPFAPAIPTGLKRDLHSTVMEGLFKNHSFFQGLRTPDIPEPTAWNPGADIIATPSQLKEAPRYTQSPIASSRHPYHNHIDRLFYDYVCPVLFVELPSPH